MFWFNYIFFDDLIFKCLKNRGIEEKIERFNFFY